MRLKETFKKERKKKHLDNFNFSKVLGADEQVMEHLWALCRGERKKERERERDAFSGWVTPILKPVLERA